MDWKFVPQGRGPDVDDAKGTNDKKNGLKRSKNEEIDAAKEEGEPDKLDVNMKYLVTRSGLIRQLAGSGGW
jgi:hypothetical protein